MLTRIKRTQQSNAAQADTVLGTLGGGTRVVAASVATGRGLLCTVDTIVLPANMVTHFTLRTICRIYKT